MSGQKLSKTFICIEISSHWMRAQNFWFLTLNVSSNIEYSYYLSYYYYYMHTCLRVALYNTNSYASSQCVDCDVWCLRVCVCCAPNDATQESQQNVLKNEISFRGLLTLELAHTHTKMIIIVQIFTFLRMEGDSVE